MMPVAVGVPLIQCTQGHTSLKHSMSMVTKTKMMEFRDRTSNTHFLSFLVSFCSFNSPGRDTKRIICIHFVKITTQTLWLSRRHESFVLELDR